MYVCMYVSTSEIGLGDRGLAWFDQPYIKTIVGARVVGSAYWQPCSTTRTTLAMFAYAVSV